MNAEIINLKTRRKQMARARRLAEASENRAKYGQSREEKLLREAREEKAGKQLDAHKRDRPEEP